jgi:hypothetical protein
MADILDYISTWSVLKWVILVLVAGFIGQFGRMMAEAMIEKMRRRKEIKQAQAVSSAEAERSSPSVPVIEASDKKMLKTLIKARKKEAKNK